MPRQVDLLNSIEAALRAHVIHDPNYKAFREKNVYMEGSWIAAADHP